MILDTNAGERELQDALTILLKGKRVTGVAVNVTPATAYSRMILAVNIQVEGAALTFCVMDPRHLIAEARG